MTKIRPLREAVNASLKRFGGSAEDLSIDEQKVPYFGSHS